MSSRLQLVRVKFFFSIFFNFLAELYHFKTFGEKKIFSKNFQKTLFGNFDPEGGLESFWSINRKLFSVKNPCGKVVSDLRYLQKCDLQEFIAIFGLFFTKFSKNPFWQFLPRRRPKNVFQHSSKVVQRQKSSK